MNWKQFLTEKVLKESSFTNTVTISCDGRVWLPRTFDNRNDLLDLYEAIYRDGKWFQFRKYVYSVVTEDGFMFDVWLFCLDGKGYEERCKMIAEFYEGREMKVNLTKLLERNSMKSPRK